MAEPHGNIKWWGLSSCLDLLDELGCCLKVTDHETLNILIIGAGDPRHILTTLSQRKRYESKKLKIFIMEDSIELYARQLLLLSIIIENSTQYGLQEKTNIYLDIFGNTFIRSTAYDYMKTKSSDFVKMVSNFEALKKNYPIFDLNNLKYREVDALESVFKLWKLDNNHLFDLNKYWNLRERHYLGTRFDVKANTYDWDYYMRLVDEKPRTIGVMEYKEWRGSGMAFKLIDGDYIWPNKTLISCKRLSDGRPSVGYWGDIITSPYLAFALKCEDPFYLKTANDRCIKTAQEISKRNILAFLYELFTEKQYPHVQGDKEDANKEKIILKEEMPPTPILDDVEIILLPLSSMEMMTKKEKYKSLFHQIYFSNNMVHHLVPDVGQILANRAMVIIEKAEYLITLPREKIKLYEDKALAMANAAGLQLIDGLSDEDKKNTILKFVYEGN